MHGAPHCDGNGIPRTKLRVGHVTVHVEDANAEAPGVELIRRAYPSNPHHLRANHPYRLVGAKKFKKNVGS